MDSTNILYQSASSAHITGAGAEMAVSGDQMKGASESLLRWKFLRFLIAQQEAIGVILLLLLIGVAVFQVVLSFPPAEADDMRLLSSVANTKNPLVYLTKDWGMDVYREGSGFSQRGVYRPLHTISIWIAYKLFGVSAFPNQFINLALHFMAIYLVFAILKREKTDPVLSFLMCGLCLVSIYTISPAAWVSDRSTLIVAICLLALIYHLLKTAEAGSEIKLSYIVGLSVVALLNKESGIIISLMSAVAVFLTPSTKRSRIKVVAVCSAIFASYMVLRIVIFGSHAFSYSESGYLFGFRAYDALAELPMPLRLMALGENFLKNIIASFFPIFGQPGNLDLRWIFGIQGILIWLPTVLLFGLACSRKPNLLQKYAIAMIILNSMIHYQVFRYRIQYISELGFCLFVAASPLWKELVGRRTLAKALATILLLSSLVLAHAYLDHQWSLRKTELNKNGLATIVERYPMKIDQEVVRKILERYKKSDE